MLVFSQSQISKLDLIIRIDFFIQMKFSFVAACNPIVSAVGILQGIPNQASKGGW